MAAKANETFLPHFFDFPVARKAKNVKQKYHLNYFGNQTNKQTNRIEQSLSLLSNFRFSQFWQHQLGVYISSTVCRRFTSVVTWGFDSSWHRRMWLLCLVCNGKRGWTGLVSSPRAVLTPPWCCCNPQEKMATTYLIGQLNLLLLHQTGDYMTHLDLFLLVLPLLLNRKTRVLLNIFHKYFLSHCWYLNWLVLLTSLRWSKSWTLTIWILWMNIAEVSGDKSLGSSERQVKGEKLIADSLLQRIVNNSSYLKEALPRMVLNNLFTIWTTCCHHRPHQVAVGVLNFHWVLKIEVCWVILLQSRDLKEVFCPTELVLLSLYIILCWLCLAMNLENKSHLLFVFFNINAWSFLFTTISAECAIRIWIVQYLWCIIAHLAASVL